MTTTRQGGCVHQHYLTNLHHTSIDVCVAFVRLSTCTVTMQDSITTKITGTCLRVQVGVTPGSTYVDPCENPYPLSRYRFLVGTGPGTSKSTQGLPMHFTNWLCATGGVNCVISYLTQDFLILFCTSLLQYLK